MTVNGETQCIERLPNEGVVRVHRYTPRDRISSTDEWMARGAAAVCAAAAVANVAELARAHGGSVRNVNTTSSETAGV
jgi:hypothetical protein